jgi:hypothetical protein
MAAALVTWGASGSFAQTTEPPPSSGDSRATSYNGNAVTCADAGLPGTIISVTSTHDGVYLDITAVPAGQTVTGVVVKGGPAYNVYLPGALGALPWLDLHAPLNASGSPAGISHWYVCGTASTTTTTPVTSTTTPVTSTTTPVTSTTTPVTSTTTPVTTTVAATTTTAAGVSVLPTQASTSEEAEEEGESEETEVAVAGTKTGGELAATGAGMPLGVAVAVGLGLLLGGAALLLVPNRFASGAHRRRH